MGFSLHLC